MKKSLILITLLTLICLKINAQENNDKLTTIYDRFNIYSQLLSPEKLYLQTDKEVYKSGDTIWFKGYLMNSSNIYEYPTSNYIYVELIAPMLEKDYTKGVYLEKSEVRKRVKIKNTADGLSGYITIPENLNTNVAILRGYTYWMYNKEPEYMFNKNIEIRNIIKDNYISGLIEEDERDSKKYNEAGVANPFTPKKEIKSKLDVQFLPESGNYGYNRISTIAFKAIGEDGLSRDFTGELYYKDSLLTTFKSSYLGMGKLNILLNDELDIKKGELYAFVKDSNSVESRIKLPIPSKEYISINVNSINREHFVQVENNIYRDLDLALIIYDGTEIYYKYPIKNSSTKIKIADSNCPAGINNIAVVDNSGNVYAQRTFFVYPQDSYKLKIASNKEAYKAREEVKYSLTNNNNLPLRGNLSVSVVDDFYSKYSGLNNNIVSYLLLNSELKGYIEEPQYYFNSSINLSEREKYIDLVMLTHGWNYYELPEILSGSLVAPTFGKEYNQTIQGYVKGAFRNAKESIVSFVAPSINFTAMGNVDTSGFFILTDLNFPDSTEFTVSAVSTNLKTRKFTPYIDSDVFAKEYDYQKFLKNNKYSKKYTDDILLNYYNAGEDISYTLETLYVRGSRLDKEQNISPFPSYTFKPGQYRGAEELKEYFGYDVPTYIVTTCPPLRFAAKTDTTDSSNSGARTIVCRSSKMASNMSMENDGWAEIKIFINGIESNCEEISGMNMSDVEGFAYIKSNEASRFNFGAAESTSPKSVVLIKTKQREYGKAINIAQALPIGWQKPKKIYQPKYETQASKNLNERVRSTIYWNPSIKLEDGKANFSFYTSDHIYPYTVIVEGILEDGTPVFIMDKIERVN